MIMRGDSYPRGHEFESQILDGSFFAFICCEIVKMSEENKLH